MSLTKKQILEAEDRPVKELNVPEWGGSIFIRTLSGRELDDFEAENRKIYFVNGEMKIEPTSKNIRARLVARCLCDATGQSMNFTPEEVNELGKKSSRALDVIFEEAQKINGMTAEAVEDAAKK